MPSPVSEHATRLLGEAVRGDASAASELLPLVYDELHAIAVGYFRKQPRNHTLQPTALVHEAFLRLVDKQDDGWESRAHFLAVASTAMRQILVNHAKRRLAAKRGGDMNRLALRTRMALARERDVDVVELDEALTRLATLNSRMERVVELRYFAGLTVEEVAHMLGVSKRTIEDDWRIARAWLARELSGGPAS